LTVLPEKKFPRSGVIFVGKGTPLEVIITLPALEDIPFRFKWNHEMIIANDHPGG